MSLCIHVSMTVVHRAQETGHTLESNMFQYFTVHPLYTLLRCQFTNVCLHINRPVDYRFPARSWNRPRSLVHGISLRVISPVNITSRPCWWYSGWYVSAFAIFPTRIVSR